MTTRPPPPLVSVIIPAFNAGTRVTEAIESILAQTYPRTETIVVNDGSTDGTQAALEAFASRINLISQRNSGVGHSRNRGCEAAWGEFIALMDHDDLCVPDRIAIQVAAMESAPEAVLCSAGFSAFDESGPLSASHSETYISRIRGAARGLPSLYPEEGEIELALQGGADTTRIQYYFGDVYGELAFGNFIHTPTIMFRRHMLERSGKFDETLRYNLDWEWIVRMSQLGPFHLRKALLNYRVSANQLLSGHRNRGKGAAEAMAVAKKFWGADPEFATKNDGRPRAFRAEPYGNAASALSEFSKVEALHMLVAAVGQGADRAYAARDCSDDPSPSHRARRLSASPSVA